MKLSVIILSALLLRGLCFAAQVEKLYYVAEFKLSEASGKVYGSQVILLEKTVDPDNNLIIERAVVVKPDGNAEEFTITHKVTVNTFTLSDTKGTVTGAGTLFGPEWKWTYFKATIESTNGSRIEDEN